MEIKVKNPGMPPFVIERPSQKNGIKWSFKATKITDKFQAREGELTLPASVPIKQFAEVTFKESGKISFRGYVEQYEIDESRSKRVTLAGMERQLECRYTPSYFYKSGTTLEQLFTHVCTVGDPPGLLAIANGLVPPGRLHTFIDADNNTIQLPGAGSNSRYGTKPPYYLDYKYLKSLAPVHDIGELAYIDLSYYRDADDLYVRIDHDYSRGWADQGGLIVDGAFDTSIRLGDCPVDTLNGNLATRVLEDNIADLLTDLVHAHDYFIHFRDEAKLLYIDIDDVEGRA